MERSIVGFHTDSAGDWVAELVCGHCQHVRHRPPFEERTWVLDEAGRASRLRTILRCPNCDRAELPDAASLARTSPVWDERSVPAGLLKAHRIASGTWGRIVVLEGRLRFSARTEPPIDVEIAPDSPQAIPPDVEHEVAPVGPVRFLVEFWQIARPELDTEA